MERLKLLLKYIGSIILYLIVIFFIVVLNMYIHSFMGISPYPILKYSFISFIIFFIILLFISIKFENAFKLINKSKIDICIIIFGFLSLTGLYDLQLEQIKNKYISAEVRYESRKKYVENDYFKIQTIINKIESGENNFLRNELDEYLDIYAKYQICINDDSGSSDLDTFEWLKTKNVDDIYMAEFFTSNFEKYMISKDEYNNIKKDYTEDSGSDILFVLFLWATICAGIIRVILLINEDIIEMEYKKTIEVELERKN